MGKAKPQPIIYLITCSFFYLVCSYFMGFNSFLIYKNIIIKQKRSNSQNITWTTDTVIAKISGMPLPQNKYIYKKHNFVYEGYVAGT